MVAAAQGGVAVATLSARYHEQLIRRPQRGCQPNSFIEDPRVRVRSERRLIIRDDMRHPLAGTRRRAGIRSVIGGMLGVPLVVLSAMALLVVLGVALGGTELPILLPEAVIADVPVLDTTALHVSAIVRRLRQADAVTSETRVSAN